MNIKVKVNYVKIIKHKMIVLKLEKNKGLSGCKWNPSGPSGSPPSPGSSGSTPSPGSSGLPPSGTQPGLPPSGTQPTQTGGYTGTSKTENEITMTGGAQGSDPRLNAILEKLQRTGYK